MSPLFTSNKNNRSLAVSEGDVHFDEFFTAYKQGIKCFIISGAAGTGKTTFIKTLCSMFERERISPCLMAPTGRAAKILQNRTKTKQERFTQQFIHLCMHLKMTGQEKSYLH